jgi:hypothetical protein
VRRAYAFLAGHHDANKKIALNSAEFLDVHRYFHYVLSNFVDLGILGYNFHRGQYPENYEYFISDVLASIPREIHIDAYADKILEAWIASASASRKNAQARI